MKFRFKKIYIILLFLILIQSKVFSKENKVIYSEGNISNYFSGIVSAQKHDVKAALKYFKKVKLSKNQHARYNVEFLSALVLVGKFDKALEFSKNVSDKNELFFEGNLLLGLNFFKKKDYEKSGK